VREISFDNLDASVVPNRSADLAHDERQGLVGRPARGPRSVYAAPADPADATISAGSPEDERTSGSADYLALLARIHRMLRPDLYLEIGVREGRSLALATGAAIGIDPNIKLAREMPTATLFQKTSDEFFELDVEVALDRPIALAFIDGLHLFENALRDFRNIEKRAAPTGLVVADDIFPGSSVQGSRFRRTRAWTGDVWRLVSCLARERPDLLLLPLDCAPAGLLLIAGLDPSNDLLWMGYDKIIEENLFGCSDEPPPEVLARAGAIDPGDPLVDDLLTTLRRHAEGGYDAGILRSSLGHLKDRYRNRSRA
jgi:predicted O-methyltransferase YrrM